MQHLDMAYYQSSKYDSVRLFLEDNDVIPDIWDAPIFIPAGTRRRATFKGVKNGKSLTLGYSQSKSHNIFNLRSCDVLDSDIVELQSYLTTALAPIIPHKSQISLFIQKCDNGMDVVLTGKIGERDDPDLLSLETIADIVNSTNIIRLSWRPNDKTALHALKNSGHKTAWARDLFRDPLTAKELNKYDTVIIDPPRAGAKTQVRELAKSKVKTIIHVSCNPNSFVRDAKTLIDAEYKIKNLRFVDQFIWSTHSELIAKFIRD